MRYHRCLAGPLAAVDEARRLGQRVSTTVGGGALLVHKVDGIRHEQTRRDLKEVDLTPLAEIHTGENGGVR